MATCTTVSLIPGPRGTAGADGADGTDGVSAFTTLSANFTMPAELATVVVTVADASWMTTGNAYYVQNAGWFEVTAIGGATSVTLRNLEDTATDSYPDNVAPGTIVALGNKVTAAGIQGPAGTDGAGGAPTDATYITQTPNGPLTNEQALSGLATGLMQNTTATGVISIVSIGVTNGSVPLIDDAGGLTSGEAMFATAAGVETKTAALSRTALGLGTMATQAASAVAITGGTAVGITVGSVVALNSTTFVNSSSAQLSGATSIPGTLAFQAGAIQSLLAATQITPDRVKVRVAGNGGAVTLTGTPTIVAASNDGQLLILQGTSDANTVTLQDEATLPTSGLALGAATRLLGAGDMLMLMWDSTNALWYEIAFANN